MLAPSQPEAPAPWWKTQAARQKDTGRPWWKDEKAARRRAEQAKTAAKPQQPAAPKAQPAPQPQPQPQPKPEPTPAPAPKKAEQALDRAAIGQRNLSLARAGKMPELKALFVKFGIDNFKDLPDARLADWCAELDKLEA